MTNTVLFLDNFFSTGVFHSLTYSVHVCMTLYTIYKYHTFNIHQQKRPHLVPSSQVTYLSVTPQGTNKPYSTFSAH
jgi:hypothetical protein